MKLPCLGLISIENVSPVVLEEYSSVKNTQSGLRITEVPAMSLIHLSGGRNFCASLRTCSVSASDKRTPMLIGLTKLWPNAGRITSFA